MKQVSSLLRIKYPTVWKLARAGKLPGCYRLGKLYRVRPDALEQLRGGKLPADEKGG